MSTRTRKASSKSERMSATPERSSSQGDQPKRPMSPARIQRINERLSLQNLNDRFANVVELNKRLANENATLRTQIQKKEETRVSQSQDFKKAYEKEISQLRLMVDGISKEKATLQLHFSSAQEDLNTANAQLKKKTTEADSFAKKNGALDNEVKALRQKLVDATDEKKRLEAEVREIQAELNRSDEQKKVLKKQIEEETILRVDLENRNQSLNEELEFKTQMYQKEVKEIQRKETTFTKEIRETARIEYIANLEEARRENEQRIEYYRRELEERYEGQIGLLEKDLETIRHELANSKKNIKELNASNTMLISEGDQIRRDLTLTKDKLHDIQKLLQQERDWNRIALEKKDADLEEIRRKYIGLFDEHNDLVDEKIRIDSELNTYRQLLETEESRLNISPPREQDMSSFAIPETPPRASRRVGNKRKALVLEEEEEEHISVTSNATGDVEISDHDQDGKFVKLHNKGETDSSLGGWTLVRQADSLEATFKFPRSAVLKAGQTLTVWSSSSEATHQPPSDYVMKSQNWFTADIMSTRLVNPNQEEMASRLTEKRITMNSSRGYDFSTANRDSNCILM